MKRKQKFQFIRKNLKLGAGGTGVNMMTLKWYLTNCCQFSCVLHFTIIANSYWREKNGGNSWPGHPQAPAPAVWFTLITVSLLWKSSTTLLAFPEFPSVHPSQEALLQMFKHYNSGTVQILTITVCSRATGLSLKPRFLAKPRLPLTAALFQGAGWRESPVSTQLLFPSIHFS